MWKEQLNEPSESVKLAYIGNVYSTLSAFWVLRGRLALAVGVLSLILLGITLGVACPSDGAAECKKAPNFSFRLAGLSLAIPLVWFLVAGAAVLAALVVAWYAVLFRVNCLYEEIKRRYKHLKYRDPAVDNQLKNPFHSATFYGALRAPYMPEQWRNSDDSSKDSNNRIKAWFVKSKEWREWVAESAKCEGKRAWFVKTYEWLVAQLAALVFVGVLPIATEGVIFWKLLTIPVERQELPLQHRIFALALSTACMALALGAFVSYHLKKPENRS